jgi:hypothetical protein
MLALYEARASFDQFENQISGSNEKENGARGNGAAGTRATWMGKSERVRLRENAESSGATWTGSPKGVFEGRRKHHKPRQGVAANTLAIIEAGAVGFIEGLGLSRFPN